MRKTTTEKIESVQTEIQQLKEREKTLRQQHKTEERKARTRRFCTRAGYIESVLPETATLTDEQFRVLINRTLLTGQGRSVFAAIAAAPNGADENKTEDAAMGMG